MLLKLSRADDTFLHTLILNEVGTESPPMRAYTCKAWLGGVGSGTRRQLPRPRSDAPMLLIVDGFLVTGYSVGELVLGVTRFLPQSNDQPQSCRPRQRVDYKCGNELRSLVFALPLVDKRDCKAEICGLACRPYPLT